MKNLYASLGIISSLIYWVLALLIENNKQLDLVYGACLLVLLGIPHGAVDHLVAQRLAENKKKSFSLLGFISSYLGIMLAYAICWQFFPNTSFLVFIAISIFHFGDLEITSKPTEAQSNGQYWIQILRSCLLGLGILGFILFSHPKEVNAILMNLPKGFAYQLVEFPSYFFLGLMLLGFQKEHTKYFINTAITLWIGSYLPLIPAFMCYFGACHSTYSLRVLSESLPLAFGKLYLKLIPFTLLALVMGLAYLFFVSQEKWLAHSFVFLSILTLPHFFLMHQISHRATI